MKIFYCSFFIIFYTSNLYAWEKYHHPVQVYSQGLFSDQTVSIPDEIFIEENDDETLKLRINNKIFTLIQANKDPEYKHKNGVFADPLAQLKSAYAIALFVNLEERPIGPDHCCSLLRGPGSPVGYYFDDSPCPRMPPGIYKEKIYYLGKLYDISILIMDSKIRVTLVEKDDPDNLIQVHYHKATAMHGI